MNRLDGKKHSLAKLYFWPIQALQKVVDVPTWIGVYDKALAAGEKDERAVALADQAVRDAQSAGHMHDLAEVQRGGQFAKLFTQFYSYFSSTYQLANESATRVGREKSLASIMKLGTDYAMLFVVPTLLGMLVSQGLRRDEPDGDEAKSYIIQQLAYLANMYPFIREMSGALQGFDYKGPSSMSFLTNATELAKQAAQGDVDEPLLRALNRTAGTVLHYPAAQVDRTARGLIAVAEGDAPPQAVLVGPPVESK